MRTSVSLIDEISLRLEHRAARKHFQETCSISSKPLEEDFPGIRHTRATIQLAIPSATSIGNMPVHELATLSSICAYLKPKSVFEFGTYDGLTTLHLAMNSASSAHIQTIDLHPDDPIRMVTTDDTFYTKSVEVGSCFRNVAEAGRIEQIFGDTTKYVHAHQHGKIEMIFVDAGHLYELVISDTQKSLDMVCPGGVVFWHDYSYVHTGVCKCLNELSTSVLLTNIPGTTLVYYIKPNQ